MDLLARSIPGVWVYIIIWPTIFLPHSFHILHPGLAWGIAGAMALVSIIRLVHREFSLRLYRHSRKIWLAIFSTSSFVHSIILGYLFYQVIADPRFESVRLISVLVIGGVSSGVVSTLSPRIKLALANISVILLPGVVASLSIDKTNMAFIILVYLVYMAIFAVRVRKEYFRAFDNEITLEKQRAELQKLNKIDSLTQIYNRGHFNTAIELQWYHSMRAKEEQSLLLIDIDHFKAINDKHGHLLGDACLTYVAQLISNTAKRKTDLVARYGGEEFAILLSDTSLHEAKLLAEDIRAAIEQSPFIHEDIRLDITASIGIACITPEPGSSPNLLIDNADKGLYLAKEKGRNKTCCYPIELTLKERKKRRV